MIPPFEKRPKWLKGRGYLHITPKIDILKKYREIFTKVTDEKFVARHAFFPLIHSVIKERKFKKIPKNQIEDLSINSRKRAHSYYDSGKIKKNVKERPLHYATHIDSIIFGYYADFLLELYKEELKKYSGLGECITAYRRIPIERQSSINMENLVGKSTIHFASEAFKEIQRRSSVEPCVVLMFDIKSFFNELNHEKLKEAWCKLLNVPRLSDAHFNVFNAATNFRYILRDDLRLKSKDKGRRNGFDEKKLAHIRKTTGSEAFFASVADFRLALKNKEFRVFKNPFVKDSKPVGIPQGLPISAVLANLYLLEFDKEVFKIVVEQLKGYYRRYSDDILIICKPEQADNIEGFIKNSILASSVEISSEKTEKYLFKSFQFSPRVNRLTSILLSDNCSTIEKPLTYLGFEFYGEKILIKSGNLSKLYRRMIFSVKRKSVRANRIAKSQESTNPVIYRSRLKRKYSLLKLNSTKSFSKRKMLVPNNEGMYIFKFKEKSQKHNTNYFSYVKKASLIMEEPTILNQVRSHRRIFNSSIIKHLKKARNN